MTVKSIIKGVWQFCSYVFVPQKTSKDNGQDGWLEEQLAKEHEVKNS